MTKASLAVAPQIVPLCCDAWRGAEYDGEGSLRAGRCPHGSSRTTWGGWSRATAAWPTASLYRTAGEHQPVLHSSCYSAAVDSLCAISEALYNAAAAWAVPV